MDLKVILIIAFSFGELEDLCAGTNDEFIPDPPDSPQKKKELKKASNELFKQSTYRCNHEEPYQSKVKKLNSKLKETAENKKTDKLQEKLKEVSDKYATVQSAFTKEYFCELPTSLDVCKIVLEHDFFKRENLTYNDFKSDEDTCPTMTQNCVTDNFQHRILEMKCKLCYAWRQNDDGTRSSVTVLLRSAYKQPIIGRQMFRTFFVIYEYEEDEITSKWHMKIQDTNTGNESVIGIFQRLGITVETSEPTKPKQFRHEAYLWIKKSVLK